jgi:hypothetical protein
MMSEPQTSLTYPLVHFQFTKPFDNGNAISRYEVQIYSKLLRVFVTDDSLCDGFDQAVIDTLKCEVAMVVFIDTFGYQRGELILVRVRAGN